MTGRGSGTTPPEIVAMLKRACIGSKPSHVAGAIGISVSMMNRYMNGDGYPERHALQRIVNHCGESFTILPEKKI